MKTLIIAEKPSLAREIQNMLQASFDENFSNKGEYQESANYILSSFFGHLLQMSKPQAYDEKYKKWVLTDLPILPETFIYEYKDSTIKRGKLLKDLVEKCDNLINATDPDREGEGIFRIWYKYENIQKPFKRLWATSLTLKDLSKAWQNLKESKEYNNLSDAQESRAIADWLVGMNASRYYSIVTDERCPVGRVKTATLALIVKRDYEVENYKESFTYSLTGLWGGYNFTYFDKENNNKFEDKNSLELLLNKIVPTSFSLQSKNKEEKKQNPPKTFSQPDLQKEADRKFGFSLDKTLELTQSLYEKKLVTYPRTDSPYLPESDLKEYYSLIDSMASDDQKKVLLSGTKPACVKNSDSPHTAIIPTGQEPGQLTEDEKKLYELIKERFIVSFMRPKIYDEYTLIISNESESFRCILKSVKDFGFQSLYKEEEEKDDQEPEVEKIDEEKLSSLKSKIEGLKVNAIKKAKAKYFTPATLLTAMMNAGKSLENKESREIMSEVEGLGTAATRQLYPVELEKDGFIEKKGKNLISTTKGRTLIDHITPSLKSVENTAELEKKLRMIESGNYSAEQYRKEIESYVSLFINEATGSKEIIETAFGLTRPCPKCDGTLTRYKCNKCDFIFYTKIAGKVIDQKYIDQLFNDKKTDLIKGFEGKNGKFDARLRINEEFKVIFDFEKEELGKCQCGGEITESLKAFNCGGKCKHTVWKEIYGKKITAKQAIALFQGKQIKLSGCKYNDKVFDGTFFLDSEGKVKSVKK
jgi:DNA topoisomerase III